MSRPDPDRNARDLVDHRVTLRELQEVMQDMIDHAGPDAELVITTGRGTWRPVYATELGARPRPHR